jgi:hypothetical protein
MLEGDKRLISAPAGSALFAPATGHATEEPAMPRPILRLRTALLRANGTALAGLASQLDPGAAAARSSAGRIRHPAGPQPLRAS